MWSSRSNDWENEFVLRLEGDMAVVIEPRMTGLVLLADPPDHEHLRLAFEWD